MILRQISRPSRRLFALAYKSPLTRQTRLSSTEQPTQTASFYKTFGRPVAKVLLVAICTYQLVYLGWVKLEQDEVRAERQAEISRLESQIESSKGLTKSKT